LNNDDYAGPKSYKGLKEESGDEINLVVRAEESSDSSDSDMEVVRRNEDVEMHDE
jgi:hypothetical protein